MADYSALKAAVQAVVKTNGNQEITGANMQATLLSIIDSLGNGYQFMGVATPSTTPPSSPDYNIAYIAGAGSYTNFGTSVVIPPTNIAIFKYDGSWACEQVTVENGGVFDITAYNNNTTYADLAAALGTNGANVPQSLRKGGMSVKFVCSSDNKYVQYRLITSVFSTNIIDWYNSEKEIVEIEKCVFLFNDTKELTTDLPSTLFGSVSMDRGQKIRLILTGGFSANRVVIAGTDTLANRLFDGEVTVQGIDTNIIVPTNYSEIYIFVSGLTHIGEFNLKIVNDLESEVNDLESEVNDLEYCVYSFDNSRSINTDLPATLLGNVSLKKGHIIRLILTGGFSANRVVIADTDTLANRLFDGEVTASGINIEVTVPIDISQIYGYVSGLTHIGEFNVKIFDTLKINVETLESKVSVLEPKVAALESEVDDLESNFVNLVNLVDLTTGETGYFIQPDGSKNANEAWRYIVVNNIQPGKYSFSGGRHFTTYYNSNGTPIEGGSAVNPESEVRDIPSGVATIKVSFYIADSDKIAVVKFDEIVNVDETGTYPSEKLQVYSKKETDLKIAQEIEESNIPIIRVGANREYTSLVDAFNYAISLGKETEIRIDAGVYDIYQEIGGDAFVESLPSTVTWTECNPVFLHPVRIIGVGDVTLKMELPDSIYESYLTQATRLSIVNTRTSIEVDNINFVIKNCRYAIHDECDGSILYNGTLHKFKNCSFYFDHGNAAVGIGASSSRYIFENCSFDTDLSSRSLLYFHTWPVNTGALLIFKNCAAPAGKVHLSIFNSIYKTRVFFENTYFARQNAGVLVQPETNDYTTNIFDITCTNVNFSSIVFHDSVSSNPYTPKFYNW